MVAALRGDFCALFDLEMTGFAHLSCFGPETILKLNECDIRVASPGAVSDCINSAKGTSFLPVHPLWLGRTYA
jgi:hypothetical protein